MLLEEEDLSASDPQGPVLAQGQFGRQRVAQDEKGYWRLAQDETQAGRAFAKMREGRAEALLGVVAVVNFQPTLCGLPFQ